MDVSLGAKIGLAAISAVLGGGFGFIGGLLAEVPKRTIARVDDAEASSQDLCADLDDAMSVVFRGVAPTDAEIRGIIRKRRGLGKKLHRTFPNPATWAPIESALLRVDGAIKILEQASGQHPPLVIQFDIEAVIVQLERSVRDASKRVLIRRFWGHK